MTEFSTYSLWFEPNGDVAYKFQERINELSEKFNTPKFFPHVTLLGSITATEAEAVPLTKTLASSLNPLKMELTKAGYRNRFYQSLFVHIKKTDELQDARQYAQRLFDVEEDEYMPHMSLLYGDLSQEKKERILNMIGREFYDSFTANNIVLVKTDGKPDKWKRIHSAVFT